jgi:uncharacterized small protein (DUF1192 family)
LTEIPWEETEEYIRSGHRNPDDFKTDSLRTITLSQEEGIKAIIGKPKGQDTTEVQSYLFDKIKGWTLEKAKAWFKKHSDQRTREHVTALLPFRILEKIVDKPLKIRGVAMTAGMSRNFNIYTAEELQNFAHKLVSAPVYIEHVSVPNAVGKVTNTDWDGQTLFYEAEIYDDETAAKIRKGLIQHVSVAADYEHIDVLNGKVPHGLHNAELSLVAVPGIPGTGIRVFEHVKTVPIGEQARPPPSSATESSRMEEKKIEEKLGKLEEDVRSIKEHLKVPEPKTVAEILSAIEEKLTQFDKRLSKIERSVEAAEDLTVEEIKQKIAELTSQKTALTQKLEGASEEEKNQLQQQIAALDTEIQALEKTLAAKTAGSTSNGGVQERHGVGVVVPQERDNQESSLKNLTLGDAMEGL